MKILNWYSITNSLTIVQLKFASVGAKLVVVRLCNAQQIFVMH